MLHLLQTQCPLPPKNNVCVCVCWWVWSSLKPTRLSEFEPVQRTEMTSSWPHCVLLEDLSETCGSSLPLHCQLSESWTSMFFLCCVCERERESFSSLFGFGLHLSFVWHWRCFGFGQTGLRPARWDGTIHHPWAFKLVHPALLPQRNQATNITRITLCWPRHYVNLQ